MGNKANFLPLAIKGVIVRCIDSWNFKKKQEDKERKKIEKKKKNRRIDSRWEKKKN